MALKRSDSLAAQIAGRSGEPKALVDDEQRAAKLLQAIWFECCGVQCQPSPKDIAERFDGGIGKRSTRPST